MRLRKLKLAGFKSFVDPTTIIFPGSLVGVVGPNGCGKSNVIDAVRWVMGEISAKHLRGDSMADVIFNGSNSRKPIGQATVELVFDNAEGRLGGRFAGYNEIAVKRQVGRDGHSAYFLNGGRCRRKDIMDVFLGTGLGPRSYAIIEQGMISRLIEAKPEELRDYLEEAAGISKYKERRRETENRMRRTRENLERVNDLCEELGKHLTHLKRQATMAEKYTCLKEEERLQKGQLLAVRWRGLDQEVASHQKDIAEQETAVEAVVAAQRRKEVDLEQSRTAHGESTETFNAAYRDVMDAGAEIARVEESIQHLRQRQEQLRTDLSQEQEALGGAKGHLQAEEERRVVIGRELEDEKPALARLEEAMEQARSDFEHTEGAMRQWQEQLDDLAQKLSIPTHAAVSESARVEHLEAHTGELQQRLERLRGDQSQVDLQALAADVETLREQAQTADQAAAQSNEMLDTGRKTAQALRSQVHERTEALQMARERRQQIDARLTSLEALQEDALGKGPGAANDWLQDKGLGGRPRLVEELDVAPGWEHAVETVLSSKLESVCVDNLADLVRGLDDLHEGHVVLYQPSGETGDAAVGWLAAKVQAPWNVQPLVAGVRTADTLAEALSLRERLGEGESVISRDGVWLGRDWLHASRDAGEGNSVLAREQEIQSLRADSQTAGAELSQLEQAVQQLRSDLENAEADVTAAESRVAEGHRRAAEAGSKLAAAEAESSQANRRFAALDEEVDDVREQLARQEQRLQAARSELAKSAEHVELVAGERNALESRRDSHRQSFEDAREQWQKARDEAHTVALRVESLRTQLDALETSRERNRETVVRLETRCQDLTNALEAMEEPLRESTQGLEKLLGQQRELEEAMKAARCKVEDAEAAVRGLEQERLTAEAKASEVREALQALQMQGQASQVRRDTVAEQLGQTGQVLNELLAELPEDAEESAWEAKLEDMARRISRLGPINLAAIDEYEQEAERKRYLDAQMDDLTQALTTLQDAIHKIDRETRTRFKETFDKVNTELQRLFPTLFGGGRAYLELTGTDLLDTGVTVMARPPGKRNSSIHLLSGGEKALTAVALVFALFELNPAPFCLLDEVDAPLDDANVGRFSDLVGEMSQRVQFVLVTHNKATMETMQQLVGVTMNEPGVSRLVAVDVDQAAELAAS